MSKRRIVQIEALWIPSTSSTGPYGILYALDAEGVAWERGALGEFDWNRIPDLPSDPPEAPPLQDQIGAEGTA